MEEDGGGGKKKFYNIINKVGDPISYVLPDQYWYRYGYTLGGDTSAVVSDGVDIWVALMFSYHLHSISMSGQVLEQREKKTLEQPVTKFTLAILVGWQDVATDKKEEMQENLGIQISFFFGGGERSQCAKRRTSNIKVESVQKKKPFKNLLWIKKRYRKVI